MLLLLLRSLKVLSVALLFSGTLGTFVSRNFEDRQRFAYYLAGPGFGLTWGTGFVLAWAGSMPALTLWTVGAMTLSMLSIQLVLFTAGKEGRGGAVSGGIAAACLAGCVLLMLLKPTLGD